MSSAAVIAAQQHNLLNEEKKFNWIFLEKFDDYRIRLKRKRSDASETPYGENNDPYKTLYGISTARYVLLLSACIIGGSLALTFGIMALAGVFS